ncbi:unnamed protein product, partial [Prunus brigantina]
MSKGSQTIDEYLNTAKSLADALSSINKPVSDEDLVTCRSPRSRFGLLHACHHHLESTLSSPVSLIFALGCWSSTTNPPGRRQATPPPSSPLTTHPLILSRKATPPRSQALLLSAVALVVVATVGIAASLVGVLDVVVRIAGIPTSSLVPHPPGINLGPVPHPSVAQLPGPIGTNMAYSAPHHLLGVPRAPQISTQLPTVHTSTMAPILFPHLLAVTLFS